MNNDLQMENKPGWISKILWAFFVLSAIGIGLYPLIYIIMDEGLLSSKSEELLSSTLWYTGFYIHIGFGGLAMLTGWSQFISRIRDKRPSVHRSLGKMYVISVMLSGVSAIGIGFFATGGWISASGFVSLGIVWLVTTYIALQKARQQNFDSHQVWMIYSYAACFAAVTLRIYLPILPNLMGGFIPAYRLIAWLCWIPNIAVAHFLIIPRIKKKYSISA